VNESPLIKTDLKTIGRASRIYFVVAAPRLRRGSIVVAAVETANANVRRMKVLRGIGKPAIHSGVWEDFLRLGVFQGKAAEVKNQTSRMT
jgi:hypothetical protein